MKSFYLQIILFFISVSVFSQEKQLDNFTLEANYFYGTILKHNKDISHLITGHPEGFVISYSKKTFGKKKWEQLFNYPDWGLSFIYQDTKNKSLGNNFGLDAHINFYLLKRYLQLRIGQGIAYNTNPFDIETNFKNNAYGSRLLSSTYAMIHFYKENIFKNFGLKAGITLLHYSNGNIKAPNTSTNTMAFNLGLLYHICKQEPEYIPYKKEKYSEPIAYNIILRGGLNESDYINLGQQPFFVVSAYADKRWSYSSSLQAGVDFFYSKFLEKEIEYLSLAFPNFGIKGNEDFKRVGLFIGHELHFGKIGVVTQVGYYLYYPYDFEGRLYERIGLKYKMYKKWFSTINLKTHGAKAEAIEFGLGIRL
ncbi:MAG: acyloxyacyl hydrolase [Flavobacteriales bacterium]